jgi:cell division protein FtsB
MRSAAELLPRFGRGPQFVALVLVLGLVGAMAIEPTRQLLDQRDRISSMASELHKVQEGNAQLQAQIERLNNDDYMEQRARAQGFVRPGETTFVVMPPSKQAQAADKHDRKTKKVEVTPEEPPGFIESVAHFLFGF